MAVTLGGLLSGSEVLTSGEAGGVDLLSLPLLFQKASGKVM